jgi:hypothetical protein
LIQNVAKSHGPTVAISFGSFGIILICRYSVSSRGSMDYELTNV